MGSIQGVLSKEGGYSLARRSRRELKLIGILYAAPAVALYLAFVLLPFLHSVLISFYSWDGIGPRTWTGLDNYQEIFRNPGLRRAFVHAAELIAFFSFIPMLIALVLVSVMNRRHIRALTAYRAVLFLPYIIAPSAVAVIWRWLLSPNGPINSGLSRMGLGSLTRPWLGDFTFALPSVGLVGTWTMTGVVIMLFLGGVQKIPLELYEAARIDGAGWLDELRTVTVPGLRYEIAVVLVLTVTAALRNFDSVYVLTFGGPGNSTTVPSWLIYNEAFVVGAVGAAAALGVVLAVVISVVNIVIGRLARTPA